MAARSKRVEIKKILQVGWVYPNGVNDLWLIVCESGEGNFLGMNIASLGTSTSILVGWVKSNGELVKIPLHIDITKARDFTLVIQLGEPWEPTKDIWGTKWQH